MNLKDISKIKISEYDSSVRSLIFANIIVIIIAVYQRWSLTEMMIVYLYQNVIIGFFNVLRMMDAELVIKKGVKIDPAGIKGAKIFLVGFFIVHYGLFQFGYFQFLRRGFREIDQKLLLFTTAVFFINHLYSYIYYKKKGNRNNDLMILMFGPYRRIVPMHVTIIFGSLIMLLIRNKTGEMVVLILFLILKTVADVHMHIDEHRNDISERFRW